MLDRKIAPEFKEVKKLNLIEAEKYQLDNGLPLFIINAGTQDLIRLEFLFPAAVMNQAIPFLADATNSLVGEGTRNYTAEEIAEKVDFYGSFLQKSAGVDNSRYRLTMVRIDPLVSNLISQAVYWLCDLRFR